MYGQITEILIVQNVPSFRATSYTTLGLSHHYHSYILKAHNVESLVFPNDLVDPHTVFGHSVRGYADTFITRRSYVEKV